METEKKIKYFVNNAPYVAINKHNEKGELTQSKQTFRKNNLKIGFHYFGNKSHKNHIEIDGKKLIDYKSIYRIDNNYENEGSNDIFSSNNFVFDEQSRTIGIFLIEGENDTKIEHEYDLKTLNYSVRAHKLCRIMIIALNKYLDEIEWGMKIIKCKECNKRLNENEILDWNIYLGDYRIQKRDYFCNEHFEEGKKLLKRYGLSEKDFEKKENEKIKIKF